MLGAVGLMSCSGVSSAESSLAQFGLSLESDGAEAPLLSDAQAMGQGDGTCAWGPRQEPSPSGTSLSLGVWLGAVSKSFLVLKTRSLGYCFYGRWLLSCLSLT